MGIPYIVNCEASVDSKLEIILPLNFNLINYKNDPMRGLIATMCCLFIYEQIPTCSVSNNSALSNIWLPSKAVTAINRNKPSSTDVGISVSGVGNINRDKAIRVLEIKPDSLVSLTLTMLKKKRLLSISSLTSPFHV